MSEKTINAVDETQPLLRGKEEDVVSHVSNAKYVLFTNIILSLVSAGFMSVLAIYIKESLGFSESFATTATMVGLALSCGMSMVGGNLADSIFGHAQTLRGGVFCLLVSYGVLLAARVLFIFNDSFGLFRGLSCIAIALVFVSGFYKPCISTLMGDQFLPIEDDIRTKYFSWFYMSIQIGAVIPQLAVPALYDALGYAQRPTSFRDGPAVLLIVIMAALILAVGVLMVPWKRYVKKPVKGNFLVKCLRIIAFGITKKSYNKEEHWLDKSKRAFAEEEVEDTKHTLNVLKVFITLPLFWAIFMQMNASWVFQADRMDRRVHLHFGSKSLDFVIPAASIGTANPLMDIALIPAFSYLIYPLCERLGFPLSELKKMGLGQLFAVAALVAQCLTEWNLSRHPTGTVTVWWMMIQYFFISCAEIMLAVSAYEFAYSQATQRTRGTVTAVWLLTLSTGALLAGIFPYIHDKIYLPASVAQIQVLLLLLFLFIASNYHPRIEEPKIQEVTPVGDSVK